MDYKRIVDQQSDKSLEFLLKHITKVASEDLRDYLETIELDYDEYTKLASDSSTAFGWPDARVFPLHNAGDTVLSKFYFDMQKEQMPAKIAQEIGDKIESFLELYEIPESLFEYKKGMTKKAATPKFLLPTEKLFKYNSKEDLVKCAEVFVSEHDKLLLNQRVKFSENFIKAASEYGVDNYPDIIAIYSATLDSDFSKSAEYIELRAYAAKDSNVKKQYKEIAELVKNAEADNKEELRKLAELLHALDTEAGMEEVIYKNKLPDAYKTVFNKQAEDILENEDAESFENMSKADIVGKFGEGILEEVENEDGTIDYDKLKELAKLRGE